MHVSKFGIEVGDYLLGGSMDCQGNISTRGRGEESHDQRRPRRSLRHRGKGGGGRARGRGRSRGSGRLGTGFRGGLGRGFLSSSCLGRGPRAVDFSSKLLDLACQQGEGQVKGGVEEPKLLLREGRGSGGSKRRGAVEGAKQRFVAPVGYQPGEVGSSHQADLLRIQTTVHPGLNLGSEGMEEGDEGMGTSGGTIHFAGMMVVRGKGGWCA